MSRALGAQMEPQLGATMTGDSSPTAQTTSWLVNSNLVSMSVVAAPTYQSSPVQVELAAPLELQFKHQAQEPSPVAGSWRGQQQPGKCAYWDATSR